MHVFCHAVPGTWHAMGVMLSAAGSLAWLRACSARPTASSTARRRAGSRASRACCSRPTSQGERTPHADPDVRGAFTGLSLRHDRGALARAVLEGVAYGLRDSLELLRALGVRPTVGPRLGRRRAQRSLAEDRRLGARHPARAHRSEAGAAFGAALLAGVREGVFADAGEAVARCVRVTGRVDPDPGWAAAYEEGYGRFTALYPRLRS